MLFTCSRKPLHPRPVRVHNSLLEFRLAILNDACPCNGSVGLNWHTCTWYVEVWELKHFFYPSAGESWNVCCTRYDTMWGFATARWCPHMLRVYPQIFEIYEVQLLRLMQKSRTSTPNGDIYICAKGYTADNSWYRTSPLSLNTGHHCRR